MWSGPPNNEWLTGTVKIADGAGGLKDGVVRQWPWIGAIDLVGDLKPTSYGGNRGFGGGEWPGNTIYAAQQLFTDSRLGVIRDRLIGAVDLRMLSGTASVNKLVLSYDAAIGATSVNAMTEANWAAATIASPVGGAAQPAAFWDNSTYPDKSIAPLWVGQQILAPLIRDAAAVPMLVNWITANPGSEKQIIGVSDTYAHCVTMQAASMYAMQRFSAASPTLTELQAADTANFYGVLVASQYLSNTVVTQAKGLGLKVWVYNADTSTLVDTYANMGVDGIYTTTPIAALTGTTPPPNPSGTKTVFGYSAESWSGVQSQMGDGLLTPRVLRLYEGQSSNPIPSISSDLIGRKDPQGNYVGLWDSLKPIMSIMNSTSQLQTMATNTVNYLKNNIPMGQHVFITIWHEPEETTSKTDTSAYNWRNTFSSTSAWQTAWQNAHTQMYNACVAARALGHKFYVAPLICDWTIWNTSKGSASTWFPLSWTSYDVMGWDIYPTGQASSTDTHHICHLWCNSDYDPIAYTDHTSSKNPNGQGWYAIEEIGKMARARNKPWCNGETGIVKGSGSYYLYSGRQRAQRYLDIGQHLASCQTPPWFWTWYDDGGCTLTAGGDPAGSGGGDSWPAGLGIAAWNKTLDPAVNGAFP